MKGEIFIINLKKDLKNYNVYILMVHLEIIIKNMIREGGELF
jgi:hypothetical protein